MATAALAALALAVPVAAASATTYTALGDSYCLRSGDANVLQRRHGMQRSPLAYPPLVAAPGA